MSKEQLTVKTYMASDIKAEDGKREVVAVISTLSVDQVGDVVLPGGLVKKDFSGLPIYNSHEYIHSAKALPIGAVRWIKAQNDNVISKGYISDKTQDSRDVFGLMQDGVLKGVSIGFKTLDNSRPTPAELKAFPTAKNMIRKWDIKEWSVTPMPCNEQAVALMVSKGYSQKTIDMFASKKQATAVVVEAVKKEVETKVLSTNEQLNLIAKHASASPIKVDIDQIIKQIFQR